MIRTVQLFLKKAGSLGSWKTKPCNINYCRAFAFLSYRRPKSFDLDKSNYD
jgi:hypothetical protein